MIKIKLEKLYGEISIDGVPIRNCKRIILDAECKNYPKVTFELCDHDIEIETDDNVIIEKVGNGGL